MEIENSQIFYDLVQECEQISPQSIQGLKEYFKQKSQLITGSSNQNQQSEDNQIVGQGGYGLVVKINEKSVVKIIPLNQLDQKQLREVVILKTTDHPNIVKCYRILIDIHNIYIQLEYCNQGDLINIINSKEQINQLNHFEILYACFQIASGLNYLHTQRIIHRDLKFDNILVHFKNGKFTFKIADFGLSKKLDVLREENQNLNSIRGGTSIYNAPENFVDYNYSFKADVFSLGIVFYGLLTKKLPFQLTELYKNKGFPPSIELIRENYEKNQFLTVESIELQNFEQTEQDQQLKREFQELLFNTLQINPEKRWDYTQTYNQLEYLAKKYQKEIEKQIELKSNMEKNNQP